MAAPKCDLKYYKYFMPERRPSRLTSNQLNKIANMTDERAAKYLSSRDYLNDDSVAALEGMAALFPQRFAQTTNKGKPTQDVMNRANEAAQRMAKENFEGEDYLQQAGDAIASNFRKNNPMSMEERALAYPAFANRMSNLPLLVRQIKHAVDTGNDKVSGMLGLELVKTMGVAAGVMGDKNAVSVALNSMKYLNRQIKQAQSIQRLLVNGDC